MIAGDVIGGLSFGGGTHGNVVKITGGTVSGDVVGGRAGHRPTPNDTVIIGGNATIRGNVIGGESLANGGSFDNRVILKGNPTFGDNTVVFGGISNGGEVYGNVLEVHTKGLTFRNVQNFAEYHFLLPANTQNNDVILTLTDQQGTDLGAAGVGVAMQSGGHLLQAGDKVALIHNTNGVHAMQVSQIASGDMKDRHGTLYQGVSVGYKFALKTDRDLAENVEVNQNLYAVITQAATVLDQTKAPVEARTGGLAFLGQAADLTVGDGMVSALRPDGVPLFFVLSGGSSSYETGSHVDVDGFNMMLGAAMHFGTFTVAPFIEGGDGSYDTYNDFTGYSVHGSGDTSYVGAGVMLHQQWQSGLYVQGVMRGGSLDYDWHSYDMKGAGKAAYDSSASYFGANVGLGYKLPLNDSTTLDLSAKYYWTHLGDDSVTIAGDRYDFDSVDSQRTRVGARVSHAFNDRTSAYADIAWLHEFDGEARATVYGMNTPAPSLEGDTGEFGVGVNFSPSADSPLSIGLGVKGYVGTREGISGQLNVGWSF